MRRGLDVRRDRVVGPDQAQRIHETALGILRRVGLWVDSDELRQAMERAGFTVRGQRVYLEPRVVDEYVAEHRRRLEAAPAEADDGILRLHVSPYNHDLQDPFSGELTPFTTERLVEMTRFLDTLREQHVYGSTPGYPADVSPDLQPLIQYRIGAEYSRGGGSFNDISEPWVMEHVMAMAEVMERPVRRLPVYLISPLRLGGSSLDMVLHFRERLEGVHISGMPACGATAPIDPFGALALSAAEAMGAYVALTVGLDIPVQFSVWAFPFDLRAMTMVFGSPENFLLRVAAGDLNRFYGHRMERHQSLGDLYVMAKEVGPQAAAEKASLMTAAALLGERTFAGAGSLSMDDIFSPLQLLIDCEIRNHVQQLVGGLTLEHNAEDWVQLVEQGVEEGFLGLESTLRDYRRFGWYPRLFDRVSLGAWQRDGAPSLLERAREMYRQQSARYSYELDPVKRREIYRIWNRALEQAL